MITQTIYKRLFTACNETDAEKRRLLNEHNGTSQYGTSHKWGMETTQDGRVFSRQSYKTRKDAIDHAKHMATIYKDTTETKIKGATGYEIQTI